MTGAVISQWDELRTALYVHDLGTVSGAAEALGVHLATVILHIDSLESALGTKLFTRHAQGYTATAAGAGVLAAAQQARRLIDQASSNLQDNALLSVRANITISMIAPMLSLMAPGIDSFLGDFPNVSLELRSTEQPVRLELGEAELCVRAGQKPTEPDYVVQHFRNCRIGLYASDEYIAKFGKPRRPEEFDGHRFVVPSASKPTPFAAWARRNLPKQSVRLSLEHDDLPVRAALLGIGIALLPDFEARTFQQLKLVQYLPEMLNESLWLITHRDVQHSALIKKLIEHLRKEQPPNTLKLDAG
ncbi:MAG: LysR family transcriptional regulator [Pseudomonadota bacterium]